MQAIIGLDGRIGDFVPDGIGITLAEGLRVEHVDDSFVVEHDPWDYLWTEDGPVYIEPEPEPYSPAEAIAIMMRGDVTDAEAVRLKPYISAFDASRVYSEGDLAVRSEKVVRRTSIGWRELG